MKKSGIILLGAMCLTLVGCVKPEKNLDQAKLFYAYQTENLMADWDYFDAENEENEEFLERDYTLRFTGMKNENMAMQLMVHANEYINEFDFTLPSVKNEAGDVIDASNFSVAAEWYMDVSVSKEKEAYAGLYPDALIPLENYKFRRMNHIEKDTNQGLYINLVTKEDMKAGKYTGTGVLTLDEKTYDIPFEVTIYDATLPSANHIPSSFLIWYELIANGEGKNDSPTMQQTYYDFIVSKRLSPDQLPPSYNNNATVYADEIYNQVANNPMISGSRLPVGSGTGFSIATARSLLNALITKNIALRQAGDNTTDLFKKLYFYVDDEPSPSSYDRVVEHDKQMFDLKVELSSKLNAYPDLKDSFVHIQNVVTAEFNDTLVATNEKGGVQTWCPQVQNFQAASARENYKARMASTDRDYGENVWWYVCESPNNPYPNYHLDGKLLYTRTMKYMHYAYGIQGELHWNVNYYAKYANGFTSGRDIWYDPLTWERCNGDGAMVYPGRDYAINGPITTLRLESILSANEDYEYQWMINEKVQEYNATKGTSYETTTLLQKYYSKMFKDMKTICTNEEFENTRVEILKVVEKLYSNLDAGMAELLK